MTDLAPGCGDPAHASDIQLSSSLTTMIAHHEFPCLGARSVFRTGRATVRVYDQLAGETETRQLLADLTEFAGDVDPTAGFASFIAIFRGPALDGEADFERLLWRQLRQLHVNDTEPWNPDVSDDPTSSHFAFSVSGTAFFVVGLSPAASRDARRSVSPTLVFNLHEQFEALRDSGNFERMRDMIRERDLKLQGSINPMVADHGRASEARQYSGRAVPDGWVPPSAARA